MALAKSVCSIAQWCQRVGASLEIFGQIQRIGLDLPQLFDESFAQHTVNIGRVSVVGSSVTEKSEPGNLLGPGQQMARVMPRAVPATE
jgi:hypothetical protein